MALIDNFSNTNLDRRGVVVSVKRIAKRTIELVISVPDGFDFLAGQYIWLMIPVLKYPDVRGNARMFSIASSPYKKNELDIVFRTSLSGYKKTLIEMLTGTPIIFSGPFGSPKLPQETSRPIILLAGGIGVAPFLSMIRCSAQVLSGHNITLVWTNPSKEEMAYSNELEMIEKKNLRFKLIKVFGQLTKGLCKQLAGSDFSNGPLWHVIGPQGFVNSADVFLRNAGVPSTDIFFEEFYPQTPLVIAFKKRLQDTPFPFTFINPFFMVVENASNHIVITDVNGMILYANQGAQDMTGYTFEEMKGNTPRLWGGLMLGDFYERLWKTIKYDRQIFCGEIKNRRKNQEQYDAFVRISPIIDKHNNLVAFIVTLIKEFPLF